MTGIHITTQDELPGPDGDEPYVLFVNQTEYGNRRYRYAGLRLPAHQRVLGPAGPQEVHRPALLPGGETACRCHRAAGGFVPYASHRMAIAIAEQLGPKLDDVLNDFRSFYFDTALSGSPAALPSLLAFAKPDHVLFGSDWPFAPEAAVGYFTDQLDAYAALDGIAREALDRGNASRLFPLRPA